MLLIDLYQVVDKPYHRWIQNILDLVLSCASFFHNLVSGCVQVLLISFIIDQLWMDTRYYKHQFYDIIHQPLQQVR